VVLYGCGTWSLTLREEHRLRAFENRVLRRIFGPKRDELTGEWRKLHNEELRDLYCSPSIIRMINFILVGCILLRYPHVYFSNIYPQSQLIIFISLLYSICSLRVSVPTGHPQAKHNIIYKFIYYLLLLFIYKDLYIIYYYYYLYIKDVVFRLRMARRGRNM
jgi:hypothetical protein